jgi:hypothetical protein
MNVKIQVFIHIHWPKETIVVEIVENTHTVMKRMKRRVTEKEM